jgi:hypothetical protein
MKVTPPTFKTYLIQSGKRVPRYVFLVAWDNADKKHGEALARHIRAKGLLVATHCKGVADLPVRAHGG